ncbi:MAG: protein-L-isoaspartate(D-aspartate) O-methyltransferase [Tepidimonas ignava]|uniref:Protein-L-isoaspartate O-methyltransferase n=1 Tax=Tepidimonas ignava TaxID=114249 RepID=A0A4R3LH57_9BURK|nr:protein-L-isoaspartate(D-aspartate) O-methyltransferase [Tepidimonas ignava]MCX7692160.1 protein-L-isoaspartate(D-aspartate) O-methyltransferase [Tepidimonas taiwanensis]TCS99531.1 protein-L-isoaspartate(D-aspartate) O-methyltransferase [Tepidimonas ignava]TSE18631.1 Protein-L-isoaspartate O-methyltransferase [Tepidimonas ignava]
MSQPGAGGARGRGARFPATLEGLRPAPAVPARRAGAATPGARPAGAVPSAQGVGLDSAAVRQAMVQRLAQQGVTHPAVLQALAAVERHRFVDSALVPQAYEDTALPIGWGQTISKPSVVARMLELLCAGQTLPLGRVLEIGTGCGYQAALLARLAREVYSMERLRALHDKARDNLRPLRIPNLHLILGDGTAGYPAGAPYAGIIAAAGGEAIPQAWLDQLAVGGRLVAPAEVQPGQQRLVVVQRTATGWQREVLEGVRFVPLQSGVL